MAASSSTGPAPGNPSQSDTSLWLHNKLGWFLDSSFHMIRIAICDIFSGTSNDSWTGGSIVSQLNPDILAKIQSCFQVHESQRLCPSSAWTKVFFFISGPAASSQVEAASLLLSHPETKFGNLAHKTRSHLGSGLGGLGTMGLHVVRTDEDISKHW